jgi:hypothetical protein
MGFTVFGRKTVAYRAGYATSGIDEINTGSANGLMVFPNPTNGDVTLTYNRSQAGESVISLYDLMGRILQTVTHADVNAQMQIVKLNVSQLPIGMYELRVVNAENTTAGRLQILK